MGEFLDFMRMQHINVHGVGADLLKRVKTRDERLDYDSVSNITDLSKEDILQTSLQLLSAKERRRLDYYNRQWRRRVNRAVPRHDCLGALALPRGGRTERQAPAAKYMLQMELKAKSEPKECSEKSGSAH